MQGSKFDPMNQGSTISTPGAQKRKETNAESQCQELEQAVHQLLEASASANLAVRGMPTLIFNVSLRLHEVHCSIQVNAISTPYSL